MNKDLDELLDELTEKLKKINERTDKPNKEQIIKNAIKLVEEGDCHLVCTDKGCILNGTTANLLTLLTLTMQKLGKKIPKEGLLTAIMFGMAGEEKTEEIIKAVEEILGE